MILHWFSGTHLVGAILGLISLLLLTYHALSTVAVYLTCTDQPNIALILHIPACNLIHSSYRRHVRPLAGNRIRLPSSIPCIPDRRRLKQGMQCTCTLAVRRIPQRHSRSLLASPYSPFPLSIPQHNFQDTPFRVPSPHIAWSYRCPRQAE